MTRDDVRQRLDTLTPEIAKALGEGWTSVLPRDPNDNQPCWWTELAGPHGESLHLCPAQNSGPAGRIHVSPLYPKDRRGNTYGPWKSEEVPHIYVSADKSGAQIARDIARRLLPVYTPQLVTAQAQARESEARRETALSLAQILGTLFRKPIESERQGWSFWLDLGGSAHVSIEIQEYGSTNIDLRGLNPPEAEQICRLLQPLRRG